MTTYIGKEEVTIKDLTFVPWISKEKIQEQIKRLAKEISDEYRDKNPLFIGILNGAFIFCSDLVRNLEFFDCSIEFCRVTSYVGIQSTEKVTELIGLKNSLKGRHVVFVEDIIDTGLTMSSLVQSIQKLEPESVKICTLFYKPANLKVKLTPEFIGFTIEPKFILGYGLDIDEWARNMIDIWVLKNHHIQQTDIVKSDQCTVCSHF
ncbi:hypothetical protein ABPG72_006121 [Tetrahymena utriculariae]